MKGGVVEKCVQGGCGSSHHLAFNAAQHATIRTDENQFKLKSEESVKVQIVEHGRHFSLISLGIKCESACAYNFVQNVNV